MFRKHCAVAVIAAFFVAGPGHLTVTASAQTISRAVVPMAGSSALGIGAGLANPGSTGTGLTLLPLSGMPLLGSAHALSAPTAAPAAPSPQAALLPVVSALTPAFRGAAANRGAELVAPALAALPLRAAAKAPLAPQAKNSPFAVIASVDPAVEPLGPDGDGTPIEDALAAAFDGRTHRQALPGEGAAVSASPSHGSADSRLEAARDGVPSEQSSVSIDDPADADLVKSLLSRSDVVVTMGSLTTPLPAYEGRYQATRNRPFRWRTAAPPPGYAVDFSARNGEVRVLDSYSVEPGFIVWTLAIAEGQRPTIVMRLTKDGVEKGTIAKEFVVSYHGGGWGTNVPPVVTYDPSAPYAVKYMLAASNALIKIHGNMLGLTGLSAYKGLYQAVQGEPFLWRTAVPPPGYAVDFSARDGKVSVLAAHPDGNPDFINWTLAVTEGRRPTIVMRLTKDGVEKGSIANSFDTPTRFGNALKITLMTLGAFLAGFAFFAFGVVVLSGSFAVLTSFAAAIFGPYPFAMLVGMFAAMYFTLGILYLVGSLVAG